jgi:soluble guanylyl cyclase beta subunit, putative (fragment)
MRAPSFRCTERLEDGALILHYYSEREGLEYIVIGIVKAVASKLHGTEVEVEIIKTKADGIDHVQFCITETLKKGEPVPELQREEFDLTSAENKISPLTFCRAFPFHLIFDRNLKVRQVTM